MTTLKQILARAYEELDILKEKAAKYGELTAAPLNTQNQISDYQKAIELITPLSQTNPGPEDLENLKAELKRMLISDKILEHIGVPEVEPELSPLPFEPETVLIPAGPFLMGSKPGKGVPEWETPQHTVDLPDYKIGVYPVTNKQYADFIKHTARNISPKAGWELAKVGKSPPQNKLDHPVVGVTWDDALAYCHWLTGQTGGQRRYMLPTEAQWEKAARGTDDRTYPWGNTWDTKRCNHNSQQTTPVNAYRPQNEATGCFDMVGNVWEWTRTQWGAERATPDFTYPYQPDDRDTLDPNPLYREYRICRGGSFSDKQSHLRCSARAIYTADEAHVRRGFRVVIALK